MATLSDPRVRDFLTEGTRTAKVAFTAGDGRPVVVPVWFIVEGEELVFNTGKTSAKGKALARDNRIALCVDLEQRPYAFVQVQGTATLSETWMSWCAPPPRSAPATWAPIGPRSSANATECPGSWWCG